MLGESPENGVGLGVANQQAKLGVDLRHFLVEVKRASEMNL
jgi:hypothetical protein